MNHRQKARRLERRRTHQSIPRGRGVPYPSRHRTDPPKHGAELKALAQEISARAIRAWEMMESDARIYGFTVTEGGRRVDPRTILPPDHPAREFHNRFARLKSRFSQQVPAFRSPSGNVEYHEGSRIEIIPGNVEAYGGPKRPALHRDEVELMDPDTWAASKEIAVSAADDHPSESEWEEITATAKLRKRSIKKFAEAAGFELIGDDPKTRESWIR